MNTGTERARSRYVILGVLILGACCLVKWWPTWIGQHRGDHVSRFHELEMSYIPALSLEELSTNSPFMARLESKRVVAADGFLVAQSKPGPLLRKASFSHAVVNLSMPDGKRLAILERNPNSNIIDFVTSLEEGEYYVFPTVYQEWSKRPAHGTNGNQ
jgi:hypothetical protein